MAADPHNGVDTPHDGDGRRHRGAWIVVGFGLAWLVRSLLRRKPVLVWNGPAFASPAEQPRIRPEPARKGHETSDAHAGRIFGIVGFLLVSGLGIHFILAAFLGALKKTPPATDQLSGSERAPNRRASLGSFPVLQVSPPADLQEFRRREEVELNGYAWVNKTSGAVRIPVERAMDLVLKQGLPVRAQTNQSKLGPSSYELMLQRAKGQEASRETLNGQPDSPKGGEEGGQTNVTNQSNSNKEDKPENESK